MPLLADLAQRNLQAELMDEPDLDPEVHRRALGGLARLNRWSRSAEILWPAVRRAARAAGLGAPGTRLRVLDVASGGGDIALRLCAKARQAHIALEILGLDISPVAVEYARGRARAAAAPVAFEVHDVLKESLPGGFDVVMSSLFLHHLAAAEAARLLRSMAAAAGRLVLVNDLRRSRPGYLLAHVACRLLTRSPVVRVDGPRSVAGAFSLDEIAKLCNSAGLAPVRIARRWPSRFLLIYECRV
jgi:SAM-dependent methyltransferase